MKGKNIVLCLLVAALFLIPAVKNEIVINNRNLENKCIEEHVEFSASILNDSVYIEKCANLISENKPVVPFYTKTYVFPAGSRVGVEVHPQKIKKLDTMLPSSYIPSPPGFEVKQGNYDANIVYPEKWYAYDAVAGLKNGQHVVILNIYLYPVRYIAGDVLFADKFEIKIYYKPPEKPLFINDEYDLLIICPDSWMADLQPLKEHKESHGIKTIIVGLDEIYGGKYFATQGRDDAEKIKYFIKDAIENWGIEYVMLVGGRKFTREEWIMPVRYAYSIDNVPPFTENGYLSDLYFADVYKYADGQPVFDDWDSNGNNFFAEYGHNEEYDVVDLYPDVYVGRLPCRNKIELKTVVKKIIEYENAMGEWRKRIILCGGDTDLHDVDDINEGEYLNEKVAELMEGFECIKLWTSNDMLSRKNFFKEMMKGAMFVDFSGHGSPNSWATHPHNSDEWIGITLFDILLYFNGNKLPIIFANACHTAQFNLTYECFGWSFVKKIGGGAIAFIGSTGLSYGFGGYATADSLSGYLEIEFFRNYFNASYVCEMFYNAIISYLNNIPMDDWQDFKSVEEYVLLGLPCLEINL